MSTGPFLSRKKFRQLSYLGEGAARIVFALNNELVLKVPKNSFGIMQNDAESYIYSHADSRFKKYLCPIISCSHGMVIAMRATPLNMKREYFSSLRLFCGSIDFYQDILDLSKEFRLSKRDIKATSSWGVLNNQKVMIDYGCLAE